MPKKTALKPPRHHLRSFVRAQPERSTQENRTYKKADYEEHPINIVERVFRWLLDVYYCRCRWSWWRPCLHHYMSALCDKVFALRSWKIYVDPCISLQAEITKPKAADITASSLYTKSVTKEIFVGKLRKFWCLVRFHALKLNLRYLFRAFDDKA